MMKLLNRPNSPYGRKARIIIRELGMMRNVEEIEVQLPANAELRRVNPLGKIPALILDDGSCIYDSPVICEYLDEFGGGKFFPRPTLFGEAKGKWRALTLQALGDGLADAVVRRTQELGLPEDKRSDKVIAHQSAAIDTALGVVARASAKFPSVPTTIGEIAICCAIGYLDLRAPDEGWRARYPALATWLEAFSRHDSVAETAPAP